MYLKKGLVSRICEGIAAPAMPLWNSYPIMNKRQNANWVMGRFFSFLLRVLHAGSDATRGSCYPALLPIILLPFLNLNP